MSSLKKYVVIAILLCFAGMNKPLFGQSNIYITVSWLEAEPMPMATTNNAVVLAAMGTEQYVYSFGGLDSSKIWSGIHRGAFKYDVQTGIWQTLPDVPDTLGVVASAASFVKDKIYVIGGYHVLESGAEISSDRVHIFDIATDSWLPDGASVPVPIDDHVQAVWRDSLIYVVTGWSNTTNVPDVQIYNPSADSWSVGTPVPNTGDYKVFGGSGVIAGDTIYYMGGARMGFNFPLGTILRKGIIDASDPTSISWSNEIDTAAKIYRPAAVLISGDPAWIGGSQTSYNYNGVAYDGSGGVQPFPHIRFYDHTNGDQALQSPPWWGPGVMDLRGAVVLQSGLESADIIIAGGMLAGQTVSDKTYALRFEQEVGLQNFQNNRFHIQPTIGNGMFELYRPPSSNQFLEIAVLNTNGRQVFEGVLTGDQMQLDLRSLPAATYFITVWNQTGGFSRRITIVH